MMRPERYKHVDELFQSALELPPNRRAVFLDQACSNDPELREEVDALLASDEQAASFIESPAVESALKLIDESRPAELIGKTVGAYKITARLGAGGMGEVYLAEDSRLGRKVALKLLDRSLTADGESRKRFLREARLASGLDHPNICTVYEADEASGQYYIAMQCLEGKTLKQVIAGRPLKLDNLLSITFQVADALAEAHGRGVIHRDIKSSNIIVTPRGRAKVLDFGLAKLLEKEGGDAEPELTRTGAVMGTPSYMSPEQALGRRADHRSDIFSFGVVIYEMATGRVPFKGETPAEKINAIINEAHRPAVELNRGLPAELSQVIDRALSKDAAERYQSMEELIADLREVVDKAGGVARLPRSSDVSGDVTVPYARPRGRAAYQKVAVAILVVILAALTVAIALWPPWRRTSAPSRQQLISSFPGSHRAASFSPDSRRIVFVNNASGVPQVWIKDFNEGEPVQLTFGDDPADRPRWSPLGDQIVFVRQTQGTRSIWTVSPKGGTAQKIIENGRNPNWSWDGKRLVFEREYDVWTASADGGDQRRVEAVPPTDLLLADRMPAFSPDDSLIAIFQKDRGPMGDIWVVPSSRGQARQLTFDRTLASSPVWTPDGFVVFSSMRAGSMTIWRVAARGGEPEPVLMSAGEDSDPDISRDGSRLIYTNARNSFFLVITDPSTGETRELTETRTPIVDPSFSPRLDKILFFGFAERGGVHLFIAGQDGSDVEQVTHGQGEENVHPHWSADGSALYYYQHNPTLSFRKLGVQSGEAIELVSGWEWGTHNGARIDPEGKKIVYSKLDKGFPIATMIRDIESGKETAFTTLAHPRWSPDGRFITGADFSSSKYPMGDIKVCPQNGGPCRILTRGYAPRWSPDGSRMYFLRLIEGGRAIWSIGNNGTDERKVMDMRPIYPQGTFFDVSPSGQIVWIKYIGGRKELWLSDYSEK